MSIKKRVLFILAVIAMSLFSQPISAQGTMMDWVQKSWTNRGLFIGGAFATGLAMGVVFIGGMNMYASKKSFKESVQDGAIAGTFFGGMLAAITLLALGIDSCMRVVIPNKDTREGVYLAGHLVSIIAS